MPKEEITLAMESNKPINSIEENLYSNDNEKNGINILDTLGNSRDEANIITNKITINKMINALEKREKEIILLRYYKDKTQSEVGKILGISQVQVSRIEKKILNRMKKELA
jgi:RNA polymerase sporulation-specific sigma factor